MIRTRRFLNRVWAAINRPSSRIGAAVLVVIGIAAGIASTAGFTTIVEYTNTLEYCTSCHEMKQYVYPGYAGSAHFSNRSGVRAICADCHVPDAFVPKMLSKARATMNELPRHILRTIHAEEDYQARREVLVHRVWERMRATDSRECRSCHEWDRMALDLQRTAARREHEVGRAEGKTCIDCHQGVVHGLPASMQEVDEDEDIDWGFGGLK